MAFESLKQNAPSVDKMLARYEDRAGRGLIEKKEMERTFGLVDKALKSMKSRLEDPVFLKTLSKTDLAELSNAWLAWSNPKLFPDATERKQLETVLIAPSSNKKAERARVYARQIWRTEITNTIVAKLQEDQSKTDPQKSDVVEAIMASQKVKNGESTPEDALRVSMHLDGAIVSKGTRDALAAEMEASPYKDLNALGGLNRELKGRAVNDFRVTVGGDLLSVPENMREALQLKNVVFHWEEGRIYAQMKNGCEGNLVIIDIPKGAAPSVEPVPPVPPVDPDNVPPVVPVLPIDPNRIPPIVSPRIGKDGLYLRADTKSGDLVGSANQFNEIADVALVSKELLEKYDTLGIEPFLAGIEALAPDERQLVLDNVFTAIGEHDPARAQQLLYDIMNDTNNTLYESVRSKLDENIANAPNPDTERFWKFQKGLFEGRHENGAPLMVEQMLAFMDSINPSQLTSELKEMLAANRRSIEFFVKRPLALDMVETARSVAESTFNESDKDDLAKLRTRSRTELADMFNNRGRINTSLGDLDDVDSPVLDTDEEVFIASVHVMETLRLAVLYAYPEDVANGMDIQNPIKYYYDQIKSGKLTGVIVPASEPGAELESIHDPLQAAPVTIAPEGREVDFSTLFVDRAAEFDLYDQYDQGNESFGKHNMWNGYEGAAGAFMGEETGSIEGFFASEGSGMIAGSKGMLEGNLFEKNGVVGGVEKLKLQKIYTLKQLGRYEEARDLCYSILEKKLNAERALTEADIQSRADVMGPEWTTKICAQMRLQLEAQGINNSTQVTSITSLDGTRTYANLDDMINDYASASIRNLARLNMKGEIGEQIFERNVDLSTYTDAERKAFEALTDLNGYGYTSVADENGDTMEDLSKMLAEIVIIECVTAGMGSAAAGVVGAARLGAMGSRAFGVARMLRIPQTGFRAGQGARRLAGLAVPAPFARGTVAGELLTAEGAVGTMSGRFAIAGRNVAHAATFVEAQHLMHGTSLDVTSLEGLEDAAYEIGTLALTFYGLGKFQQITRGETAGAMRVRNARAAVAAGTPGVAIPSVFTNPFARASELLGRANTNIASRGLAGQVGATGLEISSEIAALSLLSAAQESGGQYLYSLYHDQADTNHRQTVIDANSETDWRRTLAHNAGVVLGLRGVGSVGRRTSVLPATPPPLPPVAPRPRGITSDPSLSSGPRGITVDPSLSSGPRGITVDPTLSPLTLSRAPVALPRSEWVAQRESGFGPSEGLSARQMNMEPIDGMYSGPRGERTVFDPNGPNRTIPNDGNNYPIARTSYVAPIELARASKAAERTAEPVSDTPAPLSPTELVYAPVTPDFLPETGNRLRVRLENNDIVDATVTQVYASPEHSFQIRFKDLGNGGNRDYVARPSQIVEVGNSGRGL